MKNIIAKEKTILETITNIFIFTLIIIFPLIVDSSGFFHIFECKWYSYVIIASLYLITMLIIIFYFLIIKKANYFKELKLSLIQWLAIIFLFINILSCVFSPYLAEYNLFIGIGRGEGLFTSSLYILTFLFVTLFAKFRKKYLLYFSISSILVSSICVLQYIGFNPFNMYQNGIGTHNVSFMGTIGNIDFLSELYCLYIPIAFASFIFLDEKKSYKIIHLISFLLAFFIIGIINVSSGKVAFLATLIVISPFLFLDNKKFSRLLVMISMFLLAYSINMIINPVYHYSVNKLIFSFQFNYIAIALLTLIGIILFLAYKTATISFEIKNQKKFLKYAYAIIAVIGCSGIIFLYFVDLKAGMLHEVHELMHGNFDDDFGTYRIFLWKRAIKLIPEYPILGSGPDTFAVRFMTHYTDDVAAIGPLTINDTAANVYLTMLVNLGAAGLISYLSLIIALIYKSLMNVNKYSLIILITIFCYLVQDFFNLSIVIVTPIFWLTLAILCLSVNCVDNKR